MTFLDVLDRVWPYAAALSAGGLVPLVAWYGRRWDRRDNMKLEREERREKAQEEHEERRTRAIESIPTQIEALGDMMRASLAEQHREVMGEIRASQSAIIDAIAQDRLEEIKRELRGSRPAM